MWEKASTWEEAEAKWDSGAEVARRTHPLKQLKVLPSIPGITEETAKRLKWKSFRYMLFHKEGFDIVRPFMKHPFRYGWRYLKSLMNKKSYTRDGDFFFYGVHGEEAFVEEAKRDNRLIVVGFSYCQKPFECPSGRFTAECQSDPDHPVCRQCDIGKAVNALPEKVIPLFIPTIHYIGKELFALAHKHPDKKILFLITACEMTLEMFGDWGNMLGIQGIGVRLDGRICNTMKAFELSEEGVKPGLTLLTPSTQSAVLRILRSLNLSFGLSSSKSGEFAPQILRFSGEASEANGQGPFARQKRARDGSKIPEYEGEKPKT